MKCLCVKTNKAIEGKTEDFDITDKRMYKGINSSEVTSVEEFEKFVEELRKDVTEKQPDSSTFLDR